MKTLLSPSEELMLAIEKNDLDLISRLVKRGADLTVSSANGWTPLMLAILRSSDEVVATLLGNGADPNLTTQSQENPCRSPLAVAISNGKLEAVRLLTAYDVDISTPNCQGLTATALAQKLSSRPAHNEAIIGILSVLRDYQSQQSSFLPA